VLDRAAQRIDGSFEGEPALEADVRATIAESYIARGMYGEAKPQAERALALRRELHAEDHDELAASLLQVATLDWSVDDAHAAVESARAAVAMLERLHGPRHVAVARAQRILGLSLIALGEYDAARAPLEACLATREALLDESDHDVLSSVADLGLLEHVRQDYEAAIVLQERALALAKRAHGESSPFVAVSMNDLAQSKLVFHGADRRVEGVELVRSALAILQESMGLDHPITIRTMRNLGNALDAAGQPAEAEPLLREALSRSIDVLGEEHMDSLQGANSLANFLMSHGTLEEARLIYEDLLPIARAELGEHHPDTLIPTFNLAWVRRKSGDLDGAEELFRVVVPGFEAAYGKNRRNTIQARKDLMMLLIEKGELVEPAELLMELLEYRDLLETPEFEQIYIDIAQAASQLGDAALAVEDYALTAEYLGECFDICRSLWTTSHWRSATTESKLGAALAALGEDAEAEAHLVAGFEALVAAQPTSGPDIEAARARVIAFFTERGAEERAAEFRK